MLGPATNVEPVKVSVDCATPAGSTPPVTRTSAPPLVLIAAAAWLYLASLIGLVVTVNILVAGLKTSALFSGVPSAACPPVIKTRCAISGVADGRGVQVGDGGVPVTVGVGVTPVGDGDGVGDGVGDEVAVAVGVAPTIPCPESSTCCGLFL
ncbi:MAG: hypothetical protein WBP68_12325, partial [Candidatus Binatus sp.]